MKAKITPCLWFNGKAKEAAEYYCSVFEGSKITAENPLVVSLDLLGHPFTCLNGNVDFHANPSISFFVILEQKSDVSTVWEKLASAGKVMMPLDNYDWSEYYGWVQDKYGVSWQLSYGKVSDVGQTITPSLMFVGDLYGRAKEAIDHYTGIFKNAPVDGILQYGKGADPDKEDAVKHAQFSLEGSKFMIMESILEHDFSFNEAISLIVHCDNQQEIDHYWDKLTAGGKESMCGWLKDKFGVSWQVVPTILPKLMNQPEKSAKVMAAFMKMKKFDIATLEKA